MVKPTSGETSASASGEAKPESLQAPPRVDIEYV